MRTRITVLFALVLAPAGLPAQDRPADVVYLPNQVDEMPRRLSGPSFDYPAGALKTGDGERVLIEAVIDTSGRIEPLTLRIMETPDSAMNDSVRADFLATVYSPARRSGRPVRFLGQIWVVLHARGPLVNATTLITEARRLPAAKADSALRLLEEALDTSARPSTGEELYGLLVRGVVESRVGRREAASHDLTRGLDLWRQERARGVELAPFLNDLADSVRLTGQGARAVATADHLTVLGTADVLPSLVSRPPLVYPPEARALGVTGTVVVEAQVDATGRVSGTPEVVESPNSLLNAAAVRIVRASRYRPARLNGRPVAIRIREAIAFRP